MKQLSNQVPVLFLFLFLIHCPLISAQSPAAAPTLPAAAPAPPGPTNLIAILQKDGRFSVFIRLLQSTKVADNINSQLSTTNQGLTIFAPTDGAFSRLKTGTLNSLNDEQKIELIQFHVLPSYISPSQFQTASNPLRTQAGGSAEEFAMNVTVVGNQENITTGETNATVGDTIYTDNQLAVYQLDKVLLPLRFYVPLPPPPPAPAPPKKAAPKTSPVFAAPVDSSSENLSKQVLDAVAFIIFVVAAFP